MFAPPPPARSRKQLRKHVRHYWRRVIREAFNTPTQPNCAPLSKTVGFFVRTRPDMLRYIAQLERLK